MTIDQDLVDTSIKLSKMENAVNETIGTVDDMQHQTYESRIMKLDQLKEFFADYQGIKQDYQELKKDNPIHDGKNALIIEKSMLRMDTYFKTTFAYLFDQELRRSA